VLRKFGKLYLFQNYLCFESAIFGLTQTERIALHKISDANIKNGVLRLEVHGGKQFRFLEIKNLDDFFQIFTNIMNESKKRNRPNKILQVTTNSPPHTRTRIIPYRTASGHKLSKEDWGLILSGATLRNYQPGEVIIHEGASNKNIYQIASGRCTVNKKGPEVRGDIFLGNLSRDALFGEVTFLQVQQKQPRQEETASASVIAEDNVSCYVVESHMMNIIFVNHPNLAGRFYSYIASVLAGRVREREKKALQTYTVNLVDQKKTANNEISGKTKVVLCIILFHKKEVSHGHILSHNVNKINKNGKILM